MYTCLARLDCQQGCVVRLNARLLFLPFLWSHYSGSKALIIAYICACLNILVRTVFQFLLHLWLPTCLDTIWYNSTFFNCHPLFLESTKMADNKLIDASDFQHLWHQDRQELPQIIHSDIRPVYDMSQGVERIVKLSFKRGGM